MSSITKTGKSSHLGETLKKSRSALLAVGGFSMVLNMLMLTGPIFMLQVYDRVLTSRSMPTLLALFGLVFVLYAFYGFFDFIRSGLTSRIGIAFDRGISSAAFEAGARLSLKLGPKAERIDPVRELQQISGFIMGSGLPVLFDLPWMPLYLAIVFLLHPWLGALGAAGAVVLVAATLLHERMARKTVQELAGRRIQGSNLIEATHRNSEVLSAMGMMSFMHTRWQDRHSGALETNRQLTDRSTLFSSFTKTVRFLLQSGMLALGAVLVIQNELSAGAMIASSIILSRALAPVEQAIAHWRGFIAARQSYAKLSSLLEGLAETPPATALPAPKETLSVRSLVVVPPGFSEPTVAGVNFALKASDVLGVIGPSGSGKTTLARALVRAWEAARGEIRLDGAPLHHYHRDQLGAEIGYLPQDVELFEGTISENIARFNSDAKDEDVIAAAKMAGCHDMILQLPMGYDTEIGESGAVLSAGQRQRVGLARALFLRPFLVVLDEPNSNLDAEGEQALNSAVLALQKSGSIVVVIAHRPSALAGAGHVLALNGGRQKAFGPKKAVLEKLFGSHSASKTTKLKVVNE